MIIVASVSCIYGLGSPEEYEKRVVLLTVGEEHDRDLALRKLIDIQYARNDTLLGRGRFRVKGDVVEVQPAYMESAYRVSFFGDEVEQITHFDPLTGEVYGKIEHLALFPATQYVTSAPTIERASEAIRYELDEQVRLFESQGKMLEAHRLRQRTEYDLEMMQELGFCSGIENYSRHLDGRPPGSAPHTLLDFFPSDFVVFVDESHQTVPQLGGMYEGDRSRKQTLVDHGFRLPSALDNRPLRFDEFLAKVPQLVFVSATPGPFELRHSTQIAEQLIRPTGVVDPDVELRATKNQIDDLLNEIRRREEVGERVLVTTLTKKMAEDLTDYLLESGVKTRYLHSEVDTLERIQIIRELRLGEYDVLVGVNLLREGLDLPEVSLVAVLDADKEGFLRGKTALIQTIGRAARNVNGKVLLYGDKLTEAIQGALDETNRRRVEAARVQRGARDHPRVDRQGRLRHRGVPGARVADGSRQAAARPRRGRGHVAGRAREARDPARGGDVRGRRGAALRVRGEAAGRDQGPAPRAAVRGRGARLATEAALPGEAPGAVAPDVRLDREGVGRCLVDVQALGLAAAIRPRAAEPGGDRDRGSAEPGVDLEVVSLADGGLVDVAGEDQLRARVDERGEDVRAARDRPLARAPGRADQVVVQRHDSQRALRSLGEQLRRPLQLALPQPAGLVPPGTNRVQARRRAAPRSGEPARRSPTGARTRPTAA